MISKACSIFSEITRITISKGAQNNPNSHLVFIPLVPCTLSCDSSYPNQKLYNFITGINIHTVHHKCINIHPSIATLHVPITPFHQVNCIAVLQPDILRHDLNQVYPHYSLMPTQQSSITISTFREIKTIIFSCQHHISLPLVSQKSHLKSKYKSIFTILCSSLYLNKFE